MSMRKKPTTWITFAATLLPLAMLLPLSAGAASSDVGSLSVQQLQDVMSKVQVAIAVENELVETGPLQNLYRLRNYAPIWVNPADGTLTPMAQSLQQVLTTINAHGLNPADYLSPAVQKVFAQASTASLSSDQSLQNEVLLTHALAQVADDISTGRVAPRLVDQDIKFTKKTFQDWTRLNQIVSAGPEALQSGVDSLAPQFEQYQKLKVALQNLRDLQATGSWVYFPKAPRDILSAGVRSNTVVTLKRALTQQGYQFADVTSDVLSEEDMAVVHGFGFDHGIDLKPEILPTSTLYYILSFNVAQRIRQIELSMEKLRWLPNQLENRFIYIDLATSHLQVYENSQVAFEFNTVNGGPLRRTPSMRDLIRGVMFNPTWTSPDSIALKDKIPLIQRDPNAFKRLRMHLLDRVTGQVVDETTVDWTQNPFEITRKYLFRMDPGPDNALGIVKFPLSNPDNIYMHDTNERDLFQYAYRLKSSGCIRLEKPLDLALYLLSKEGWTAEQIDATIAKGTPDEVFETLKYVSLHRENFLPVYTLYQTAFVTGEGHLRLMTDYYGQDARLRTRLNLSSSAAARVSLPSTNQQGEF